MILPERVFGSPGVIRILSGVAIGPMMRRTSAFSSAMTSGDSLYPDFYDT